MCLQTFQSGKSTGRLGFQLDSSRGPDSRVFPKFPVPSRLQAGKLPWKTPDAWKAFSRHHPRWNTPLISDNISHACAGWISCDQLRAGRACNMSPRHHTPPSSGYKVEFLQSCSSVCSAISYDLAGVNCNKVSDE